MRYMAVKRKHSGQAVLEGDMAPLYEYNASLGRIVLVHSWLNAR